jgi:hypothetical protein
VIGLVHHPTSMACLSVRVQLLAREYTGSKSHTVCILPAHMLRLAAACSPLPHTRTGNQAAWQRSPCNVQHDNTKERKKRKKERSLARVDELRLIQLWWVRLKKGRVHDLDVSSEHNLLLAVTVRGAVCLHISVHHEADE